jgi:predicted dinucleotide-binding enzyme
MTTISIIGSGNMATAIGTRATKHGHTIELMGRNSAKAQALADQIGNGATVGTFGARPAGDIVIVAVLYTGAVEVVAHFRRRQPRGENTCRGVPGELGHAAPRRRRARDGLRP